MKDKNWVISFPKIINSNGCWIPSDRAPKPGGGYCSIMVDRKSYQLHRLVISIIHNLDYNNPLWEARHGIYCVPSCFNRVRNEWRRKRNG